MNESGQVRDDPGRVLRPAVERQDGMVIAIQEKSTVGAARASLNQQFS